MGPYPLGTEVTIFHTFTVDGVPTDPSIVTIRVEQPNGDVDTFVFGTDAELTNPPHPDTGITDGYYELAYLPPIAGTYNYEATGTGDVVATSVPGVFEVTPSVIGAPPAFQYGPCEPWLDPEDVAACCSVTPASSDWSLFYESAVSASQLLWNLSGKQFGVCQKTGVRPPCSGCTCGFQVLSRGHIVNSGYSGYCEFCLVACNPSRIKLSGYPIREITQVKIDGDVLAETEYRLDKRRWLIRKNGARWPTQQNLTLDDTEDGTFSISYTYGQDAPTLGKQAAAQLACELYKECSTGNCALPKGTTRISRQGIVVERLSFTTWAFRERTWRTGMPLVDAFLSAYNPAGLLRRPTVWSPSGHRYASGVGV